MMLFIKVGPKGTSVKCFLLTDASFLEITHDFPVLFNACSKDYPLHFH